METEKEIQEWYERKKKEIAESDAPSNPMVAGSKGDRMKVLEVEMWVKRMGKRESKQS